MTELQTTFAYTCLGILLFALACAVCAVVFANRPKADSNDAGAEEGRWPR